MVNKKIESEQFFAIKSGEYSVPQDIPVHQLMAQVIELAKIAVIRSRSSSAIVVNYDATHFNDIAYLLDKLVVGRTKSRSMKTAEYVGKEESNYQYVPFEVIEALVKSYTSQEFVAHAYTILTSVYQEELFSGLKVLAVSDFELLKAAALSMILPYQDPNQVVKLQKEMHQLLYSGEIVQTRLKNEKRAAEKNTVEDLDTLDKLIPEEVRKLWKAINDIFWGK